MRSILVAAAALLSLASCSNNGGSATFCDTTCHSDSFNYKNNIGSYETAVSISVRDCSPDSVSWTRSDMGTRRQVSITSLVNQDLRLNKDNIECVVRDTSYAWLSFNDCITGRGFLFKLPFNKANNISKYLGALNRFDPKFSIEPDLRAYTDRGSIFVMNIANGKEAVMTFKEVYEINFNKIHEAIDSIHVTHKNIYVKLKKEGKDVELKKDIDL